MDPLRGRPMAFALVHLAFLLVNVAALAGTAHQRTLEYAMHWGPAGTYERIMLLDTWGTCGRLALLAFGAYLAGLIARGDARVPRDYAWYGAAWFALEAGLNVALLRWWGVPRGIGWGTYGILLAAYLAAIAGWVACVSLSGASRATFVQAPRPPGPSGRLLAGILACALIAWPFVLNTFVEATVGLAGWISPRETSAAMGIAQSVLVSSVVAGLFVLMKVTWRVPNRWIALLLPACLLALTFLYAAQGFLLHFGR